MIPDDGRVSEDTKTIIRKLLVTDPSKRMTASQVRESLETIITVWKSIAQPITNFQVVPHFVSNEENKKPVEAKVNPDIPDFMMSLMQSSSNGSFLGSNQQTSQTPVTKLPLNKRIQVTRLGEDARPLTAEEYMKYGHIVGRLRQSTSTTITSLSSTGQPLRTTSSSSGSGNLTTASSSSQPHQLLVSAGSSLIREIYDNRRETRRSQNGGPPLAGEPPVAPVPVLEQESVLDLSASR